MTLMLHIFTAAGVLLLFASTSHGHSNSPADWYTRYAAYPDYCSTPAAMAARTIPPLPNSDATKNLQLEHVSVVIRHGARAPWSGDMQCWSGYWRDPVNIWDCDLNTLAGHDQVLLTKRYDALEQLKEGGSANGGGAANPGLANELNGTCQKGQLLLQGYDQQSTNGRHLRQAYLATNDTRMQLDLSDNAFDQIYYRADDDQRTVMSGQALLRSLLASQIETYVTQHHQDPRVQLHIADRVRDILDPNQSVCPRLMELEERFWQSSTFVAYNASNEAQTLRHMVSQIGMTINDDVIDCLMTSMCTDRPLPALLDDYYHDRRQMHECIHNNTPDDCNQEDEGADGSGSGATPSTTHRLDMFQRLYDFVVQRTVLLYQTNNAEYARLGMSYLWQDLLDRILAARHDDDFVPLAVYSGHDTTLMPLLASIGVWDGQWASYASMLVVEVYRDKNHNTRFVRLVYNGRVLRLPTGGGDDDDEQPEVCELTHLQDAVQAFATRSPDCDRRHAPPIPYVDTVEQALDIVSTPAGVVTALALMVTSFLVGAVGTFCCCVGTPWGQRRRAVEMREEIARFTDNDVTQDDHPLALQATVT